MLSIQLIRKVFTNLIVGCILLIFLITLPFVCSIIYNEVFLVYFKVQTNKYSHPPDSQLLQRVLLIGNFAPASNQCGFIVAEVRITGFKPDDIHKFYTPILTDALNEKGPPYSEVNLFILNNKKDLEDIELRYPEVYERIRHSVISDTRAYLLMTAKTGNPPNYDPRCH